MTPRTLSGWTIEAIEDLLERRVYESEDFDLKERLPDPRDEAGKSRLRATCVAFANASGGFLVFGISDTRIASSSARLMGMDPSVDFPEQFGNFPRHCVPGIDWEFKNPPIRLATGNLLHVVRIGRSWKAPHAVGDRDSGWRFFKRTNKGDEGMGIDEIRASFLGYYEKRLRLQLLVGELEGIRDSAQASVVSDPQAIETSYSLVTFDAMLIESILSDTYPITVSMPDLIATLRRLRDTIKIANNKARIFFSTVGLPMSDKKAVVRDYNEFMALQCDNIARLCEAAVQFLRFLLKP